MLPLVVKQYADDAGYRNFRCQLLHSSLAKILSSLKPDMTTLEVVHCPDGHFQCAIYGLGPYIRNHSPYNIILGCLSCSHRAIAWSPITLYPIVRKPGSVVEYCVVLYP